jgi:hypothetical protein
MKLLNVSQCQEWCASRGVEKELGKKPHFRASTLSPILLKVPAEAHAAILLGQALLGFEERGDFQGALFWPTQLAAADLTVSRIGISVLQSIRRSYLYQDLVEDTPGHLLLDDEQTQLTSLFSLGLLFGWDGLLVMGHGSYFLTFSHERVLNVYFGQEFRRNAVTDYLTREAVVFER